METKRVNGEVWYDTDGNVLHAHGGHMLQWEDNWYWYGENRTENRYVSVYKSADLVNWTFCRHVLTTDSPVAEYRVRTDRKLRSETGGKINVERPKVLYNAKTGKFVMWMHVENGVDYRDAACAVAVCDTPDGEFTYLGSFNPFGYMSRDCTLFQDKDGTAYFLSASRDNADMHVYRLSEDYLNVDCLVHKLWQGEYREAPAVLYVFFLLYRMGAQPVPLCFCRQHGRQMEQPDGYRGCYDLPYPARFYSSCGKRREYGILLCGGSLERFGLP